MTPKPVRFLWRFSRNILCGFPVTRELVFPPAKLSQAFGRGDGDYAWRVFEHHYAQLLQNGYPGSRSILEAGPGRNIGTSLLWWATEAARNGSLSSSRVVLWDVYGNASLSPNTWSHVARDLLDAYPQKPSTGTDVRHVLQGVAAGQVVPDITYLVGKVGVLSGKFENQPFGLIYSHAALEHAWDMEDTWRALHNITAPGGWHSHRIDLADHGSRNTNYIEMLEWSDTTYWLTMRFVPGATNRWRAFQHVDCIRHLGLEVLAEGRETRPELPCSLERLAPQFRGFPEMELRATAVDIIARRPGTGR